MRENGGFDDFDMILINSECYETALHARQREMEYIEELEATLNKPIPIGTHDERAAYRPSFYQDNKEVIQQQTKILQRRKS